MKNFIEKLESFKIQNNVTNLIYKPQFYRIYNNHEFELLSHLLNTPGITVVDYILDQLKELVKCNNPSVKFLTNDLELEALKHIGTLSIEQYGVWVYYPWANRLVHILDNEEFVNVRTSRNQNKITKEERSILSQKKIGVIGLSVGQSVSVTAAMERICGEIRLADFDVLELTNLNRIRTGVHNLGLPKVYSVAREIAEIDPFLKVSCFPEGLTEANMDEFFLKDGKLDLLIEESDGFDIKLLSRYKARSLQIPVVMEASDRCTVDVERFDLEPNRSILHGLVNHLDMDTLRQLKTTEEKIPYMLDVLGIETSSLRLKASMLEIEQSINTWPQLASAVTMGGGITTDVSRRLLLNQFTESGRYHIDIEEIIGNKKEIIEPAIIKQEQAIGVTKTLSQSERQKIVAQLSIALTDNHINPSHLQIQQLVDAATKAPSGGNAQAWLWHYHQGNLFLFHDVDRSSSLLDFDNLASYISFGAATENLVLKAHQLDLEPQLLSFPLQTDARVICQFTFVKKQLNTVDDKYDYLVSEIENRLTNRNISKRELIAPTVINELKEVATSIQGANITLIDDTDELLKLADVIAKVERLRMMHQRGHADFVKEIRWTDKENEEKRDGIDLNTVDVTAAEKAGFIVAKNWGVVNLLKQWNKGTAFEKLSRKSVLHSSAICLITMPKYTPLNYFNGGRSMQRTWLAANKLNVSFQPQSPATFLFARLTEGNGLELDADLQNELKKLRTEFINVMKADTNTADVFLFRLCIAKEPQTKSLRRNLDDVLFFNSTTTHEN